ncbi:MAG: LysE family translocator [Pseudomonadales bacterium]
MLSIVTAMALFALIGAASPGPVNIIATSTAAHFGLRASLAHVAGASLSYGAIVLIAGLALAQLSALSERFTWLLQLAGTLFLLHLSYRIATAEVGQTRQQLLERAPSVWQGVLSQSLNPKAWLVSMSGVALFVTSSDQVALYLTIFSALSLVICFIGVGLWALLGHALMRFLAEEARQRQFNRTMGLLLALSITTMYLPL